MVENCTLRGQIRATASSRGQHSPRVLPDFLIISTHQGFLLVADFFDHFHMIFGRVLRNGDVHAEWVEPKPAEILLFVGVEVVSCAKGSHS